MIRRMAELQEELARLERSPDPSATDALALARTILDDGLEASRRERVLREVVHQQMEVLETKILELSILKRLGDLIAGSLALDDLLERVLEVILSELRVETGSIMLLDQKTGNLRVAAGQGPPETAATGPGPPPPLRVGEGIAGWVAASREALIIPDVSADVRFKRTDPGNPAQGALLCVPLLAEDRVLGVLNLSTREVGVFDPRHVRILRIASSQVASALIGRDLHRELEAFSNRLEMTVAERTAELENRTEDLRRKNDQISDLYFSLEEAQRELESRNRDLHDAFAFIDNVVETINVGIGVLSEKGKIVTWNRAMEEISGGLLSRENILGRTLVEIPADVREGFGLGRPLADALRLGKPTRLRDHRVELPSGRVIHLNVHHIPVLVPGEGNNQVTTVIENVTDNVERHDQEVKAERLSAITATMVSVNHEINNPLAVILGYSQMLLRGLGETDDRETERSRRWLRLIERETMRIREITRKLATLAEPVLSSYPSSEGGVLMVDAEQSR